MLYSYSSTTLMSSKASYSEVKTKSKVFPFLVCSLVHYLTRFSLTNSKMTDFLPERSFSESLFFQNLIFEFRELQCSYLELSEFSGYLVVGFT